MKLTDQGGNMCHWQPVDSAHVTRRIKSGTSGMHRHKLSLFVHSQQKALAGRGPKFGTISGLLLPNAETNCLQPLIFFVDYMSPK